MTGLMRRANAVGAAMLVLVVLGYVVVMLMAGRPAGADATPGPPPAPSTPGPVLPPQGQFERAVALAEASSGGVAIKAEAKNGNGLYEVDLVLGNEEIEVHVDTRSEQVVETDREVEDPFEDPFDD